MTIVFTIIVLLFILFLFFILVGFPIWAMIDCASSQERSTGGKVVWIVLMFVFWPFVSIIYGLFATRSSPLRTLALAAATCLIIGIVGFFYTIGWVMQTARTEFERVKTDITILDLTDLTPAEQIELQHNLAVLDREMETWRWSKARQILRAAAIAGAYQTIAEDHKITRDEFKHWRARFDLRNESGLEPEIVDDQFRT